MSGPGGVGFLLLYQADGTPRVLNFSGNSPTGAVPEAFDEQTREIGPRSCLIPGNIAGWFEALGTHGRMTPADVFAPAIRHGREGFPLHPANAEFIRIARPRLNDAGLAVFGNLAPRIGEILTCHHMATT